MSSICIHLLVDALNPPNNKSAPWNHPIRGREDAVKHRCLTTHQKKSGRNMSLIATD